MFDPSHSKECASNDNPIIFVNEVSVNDILMGRGASIDKNEGNKRFREVVQQHKNEYLSTSRQRQKHTIAMKIMNEIKSRGGRFLKQIENQDNFNALKASESAPAWCCVAENVAMRKIKQILRGGEKLSQRSRMEDLPVSQNDIFTDMPQRNNDDSLNDRLQTNRSMEALVKQNSSNFHVPVNTMEFSRIANSNRSNILDSTGAMQISTANQSTQFSQELQHFIIIYCFLNECLRIERITKQNHQ